jgi:hypothetical protein
MPHSTDSINQTQDLFPLNTVVLTVLSASILLVLVYGIWVSAHILAIKLLGIRKLGCKGPSMDKKGNAICCKTGDICKEYEGNMPREEQESSQR